MINLVTSSHLLILVSQAANPAPKEPKKAKKEEESLVPATGDCTICFEKYDEDYGILKCVSALHQLQLSPLKIA